MDPRETHRGGADEPAPTVLLVEADGHDREMLGAWLEEEGFVVVACPGPRAPDYVCVGGRDGRCPLIEPANVVVLDVRLPGEDTVEGTSVSELLALYTSSGKPVIVLGPDTRGASVFAPAVVMGEWPPDRGSLVGLIRELV